MLNKPYSGLPVREKRGDHQTTAYVIIGENNKPFDRSVCHVCDQLIYTQVIKPGSPFCWCISCFQNGQVKSE